jgi:hypothetical protein
MHHAGLSVSDEPFGSANAGNATVAISLRHFLVAHQRRHAVRHQHPLGEVEMRLASFTWSGQQPVERIPCRSSAP